jgi:hypothetical protein
MSKLVSKGVRPYKTGSNAGFESNLQRKEREAKERHEHGRLTEEELAKKNSVNSQFKGFVGGKQFRTKLGFQGNAFDSIWGKHVFLSFVKDDVELFDVAMQSQLADVTERVVGGENGAAFIIGDIGFFADNQFEFQGDKIRDHEMGLTEGLYYLSDREWVTVNANIKKIADYAASRTSRAVRGDSFGALALRANAFNVARRMLQIGLDPMIENEMGEHLFGILKEQYNRMTGIMHDVLVEKEECSHRVLVPSEQQALDEREDACIRVFQAMQSFLEEFTASCVRRVEQIGEDKRMKRRMELKRETVPEAMLYNISIEDKVKSICEEGRQLLQQLVERIRVAVKQKAEHINLADLVHRQHAVVQRKTVSKKVMWSYKDDLPSIGPGVGSGIPTDVDSSKSGKSGKAGAAVSGTDTDTGQEAGDAVGEGGNAAGTEMESSKNVGGSTSSKVKVKSKAAARTSAKRAALAVAAAVKLTEKLLPIDSAAADSMDPIAGESPQDLQLRLHAIEEKRLKKQKDALRRAAGLETEEEIAAREKALKEAEEERALMAVSITEKEEAEKKRREEERLERDTLGPLQGVLYKSTYEQTSYR